MPPTEPSPLLFDRALLSRRRRRSVAGFARHDFLHRLAGEALLERRADIRLSLPRVLDLGCHDGWLARQLQEQGAQVWAADSAPAFAAGAGVPAIVTDDEFLPFAAGAFDLIVSNLNFHLVNDLPGTLLQCRQALAPDGLLLAALPGGGTLQELRHCLYQAEQEIMGGTSPRVIPLVTRDSAAALLQRAGFIMPVVDAETVSVVYPDALALLRELRALGWSNPLRARLRRATPRAVFARMAALYAAAFPAEDGGVTATFEIIYLHGWTPPSR